MTPNEHFRPIIPNGSITPSPSVQLPARGRRTLAKEKCDACRKHKKACVRQGFGCERCSEKGLKCPGFTLRPDRRRKRDSKNIQALEKALTFPPGPKPGHGTTTFISKTSAYTSREAAFTSHPMSFLARDIVLHQSLQSALYEREAIDHGKIIWQRLKSFNAAISTGWDEHPGCCKGAIIVCMRVESKRISDDEPMRHNRSLTMNLEREAKQMDRMRVFRLNFIEQYKLLAKAAKNPSARIHLVNQQFHCHRQGWASAMVAMRQLARLKRPSLVDILCFLCVSRAVAETHNEHKDIYVSAFIYGLEEWRQTYPEIEDAARLMWGTTFEFPPQPQPTAKKYNELLQLRDSVAALIEVADDMFGLGDWDGQNKMNVSRDYHYQSSETTNQAS
ncbi:hypothetical protein NPX13_g3574 [Xylaria arbuscula]|uniref:Zn(2)-C6 fungal-type domain-containing protein n=1 Tax=Xylaria arbuscula TaxID=114810 RepID=A0A9W8NI82_9PEZI|nr:hypothetical protein NPX13_g3574 [Xylaria arbuscula]